MELILDNRNHGRKSVLIDDEDFELYDLYSWSFYKSGRCFYTIGRHKETGKLISMHRLIMHAGKGTQVDHKNHNGLDNRKFNLRIGSKDDNSRNRKPNYNTRTGYKGVFIKKWRNRPEPKYGVKIQANKKTVFGGYFDSIIEAAIKANQLSALHHGEFAYQNPL